MPNSVIRFNVKFLAILRAVLDGTDSCENKQPKFTKYRVPTSDFVAFIPLECSCSNPVYANSLNDSFTV